MRKKKTDNPFFSVDGDSSRKQVPFSRLFETMAVSAAWQSLSAHAQITLEVIKLCRQFHVNDADPLEFCFNRALQRRYGFFNPNRVRESLCELVSFGFIQVISSGWTTRTKSRFRFSDRWKQYPRFSLSQEDVTFLRGKKSSLAV